MAPRIKFHLAFESTGRCCPCEGLVWSDSRRFLELINAYRPERTCLDFTTKSNEQNQIPTDCAERAFANAMENVSDSCRGFALSWTNFGIDAFISFGKSVENNFQMRMNEY